MSTAVLRSSGMTTSSEDRYAHKYIIAATVTMAAMLELIDTSIFNVAIPHMMGNLGATLDEIAWVSTAYIIANVIIIPMSGWLSAFFGRKRYFTGSILLFTLASFFCGSAHSLLGLIFWRVVQGIGGGALLSTAQATLYESFPPEEGTGMAIFGVGVMVGPTLGPTLGGWITDNYSWPWIFYINVPLGIIAAILTVTYVHDAAHQEKADKIDYVGILLLTLCVGSLQWMLERGERYDWWESRFVTLLGVTALLSGIALIWHELTTDEPVINFRILKSRQLTAGVTFGLLLGFALYGSVFILPVFLQQLLQMTAWQTGKIILPGAIASAVTMAVVGRNAMRLDARYTVIVGAFLFFWSMLKMSHLTSASGQYDLFWPLILRGVALGLIFVPLTNATMADLPVKDLAQGTGMFNLMRQLGGSLGIAVMATLLAHFMAIEKALLVEHVGTNDPETLSRLSMLTRGLVSRGINPMTAQQQALAILDRQVTVQSSMLAFSKIYLYSGLVLILALPLLLLFRTGRARGSMGPVH
ncbi:MAG: DHA2 family efflux MFS transporter permease subunit [Gemmatimonadaceae bacterium]